MKLLPILAINLAVTGVVLFAYDVMRADPAPAAPQQTGAADSTSSAVGALESRLRALEGDRRRPRNAAATDADVLRRLAALEAAAEAPEAQVAELPTAPEAKHADEPVAMPVPTLPTEAEIRRFRMLRKAVRLEDAAAKNAARVRLNLDKLALNLTDRQVRQIGDAYTTFEPEITRIWGEAKEEAQLAAGGGEVAWKDVIVTTTARVEREFAATLEGIVPASDGEAIARALLSRVK